MAITLDNLASRYHLLPSECLVRASTFDLYILNTSTKWENHKREEEARRSQGLNPSPKRPNLSQEEMLAMIKRVKERNSGGER